MEPAIGRERHSGTATARPRVGMRRPERVDGFGTVLVANRGEIACRVLRTLRTLGIRSVAVYSDADVDAPHVHDADEAVRIGPAAASASYLDIAAVLAAAQATGAQAIHPGYGFLSENVAFARACVAAGVVFIGPGERALDVMGDKIRAKAHVERHGVRTVPGFSGAGMTDAAIAAAAERAGYPLLIKPSAGGGGKGMQVVRAADDLPEALAAARRIAASAFGDDTLLLERLLERPRHIEVQVLADAHGAVVHLGERECTLQRRHQKVIEEAPSPVVDAATRARLGAAACAAAASVDYRGAGTVEFLVAGDRPDDFFFIEMNTRLQVEHPVTESVTGIDLVEQQLRIAAGLPLDFSQDDVRFDGHAIEARVYAESPERGFLPATGTVRTWRPAPDARTDAAVKTGSVVTADYDPLIAKVIAHGGDRAEALAALDGALADTVLLGVDTNIAFLRALVADPAVAAGDLDTGLIDRLPPFTPPAPTAAALRIAASLVEHERRDDESRDAVSPRRASSASPLWLARTGWRASGDAAPARALLQDDAGRTHAVAGVGPRRTVLPDAATPDTSAKGCAVSAKGCATSVREGGSTGRTVLPDAETSDTFAETTCGGGRCGRRALPDAATSVTFAEGCGASARGGGGPRRDVLPDAATSDTFAEGWAVSRGEGGGSRRGALPDAATPDTFAAAGDGVVWVHADGATHRLRPVTRRAAMEWRLAARDRADAATDPELRAPMPGAVVAVQVEDGAVLAAGARIVTIEAMKMEHPVTAPHDGVVRLGVAVGDRVQRDQVIAHVTPSPAHAASDPLS